MTFPENIWIPLAVVAIVLAALVIWWWWPKWEVNRLALKIRDPKARADVEDNFRKTIGQLLGGAAVFVGAWLTFLQFSQQQQTAQSQIRQQQQAAHDLLISNQVSKGFEQLAGHDIAMRLGGIYALEGVMNNSEQYHQPVLEALCAFVRENTIGKTVPEKPATDVQAALTVLGRRAAGPGRVDLANVSIPGANLSRADLSRADLSGAHLEGTNLTRAHLSNVDLFGANLRGADLSDANLSRAELSFADLSGADLSDADLLGARPDTNLTRANTNLTRANLSGAYLIRAHLSGANLSGVGLSGANLSRADLSGALNLTQEQLNESCGNSETKLPQGLTLKPCP